MKNHWFKLTFLNHLLVIIKMFSLDLRCRSFICVFKISQADLEKRGVLLFIHLAMKGKLFIDKVKVTTYIIWQRNITGTQRTSQGLCSLFQNFVVFFRQQGEQTEKNKIETSIISKQPSVSFARSYMGLYSSTECQSF